MKHFVLFVLSVFVLSVSAETLENNTMKLTLSTNGITAVNKAEKSWKKAPIEFSIYDGNAKTNAPVLSRKLATGKPEMTYTGKDWKCTLAFEPKGNLFLVTGKYSNLSGEEKWIETAFTARPDFPAKDLKYWDGFDQIVPVGKERLYRTGIKGSMHKRVRAVVMPFAATGIFDSKCSFFLGNVMYDPVSYTAVDYEPLNGKYAYRQRFVVAPNADCNFRYVIGSANSSFGGELGIIQAYYDSMPECWEILNRDTNPYLWGNHGHYGSWWGEPEPELKRRFKHVLDWTYCPYKRSGDMQVRKELWDYKPGNTFGGRYRAPIFGGVRIDFDKQDYNSFVQLRKARFQEFAREYGWMFYGTCCFTWCEKTLAEKYYPDAINKDTSVSWFLKSWSTGHDHEYRLFPYGTSWEKAVREDIDFLIKELDIPGFALDCCYAGAYYRGPAVKKPLEGRAWDDKGLFIDQSVAINRLLRYIRSKGQTLFINGGLIGDYCMVEVPYVNTAELRGVFPVQRWNIGPRPGCMHGHGYLWPELVPNWRNKSKDEFIQIISGLSDYVILNQFKYGLTNSSVTFHGCPQQLYITPEAFELMRAGWQALVPVEKDKSLYVPYQARYGKRENTFLYLANSGEVDTKGKIRIDQRGLDGYGVSASRLFVRKMRNFAETKNTLAGNWNEIELTAPSRVPVLFETVCEIAPSPAKLQAIVRSEKSLSQESYFVTFKDKITGSMTFRKIHGMKLDSVLLNKKAVAVKEENGKYVTGKVTIPADSTLEVKYSSLTFAVEKKDIADFKFEVKKDGVPCRIYIEGKGSAKCAMRINTFFDFLRRKKAFHAGKPCPLLNGKKPENLQAGEMLFRIVPDGRNMIYAGNNGSIVAEAKTPAELDRLTTALLDRLDERFPYVYPFRWVMGLHHEVLSKFGMLGKSLPVRNYFESPER